MYLLHEAMTETIHIIVCKISHKTHILASLFHPNLFTTWDSWRWKKQMGAGGHQLWPVSQVTTLAIVTSRLKPHVYIPRSCSGSAGSCPFTSTPTNELGAKHDVITPIWLGTSRRTAEWSAVFCACLPRQGYSNKGHDLPLSATDLWDYWVISGHLEQTAETTEWVFVIQMWFIYCHLSKII